MSRPLTGLAGLNADSDDFLVDVLGAIAQPVWVVDQAGVIRFANAAAITALGYARADELLGRPSHETIHYQHPDGTPYPAAECPMLLPRTSGETVSSDLDWFFRRDGSMFPVSYVSVPLRMQDGRGAVVAFNDIEERLSAERMLHEHDAMLGAEQASLRRLATLVAAGAASGDVFAAVAEEVGHVTGLPLVAVWRYGPDGTTATVVGAWGEHPHPFQAGTRWPLDGPTICAQVLETGRPARIDDFATFPGTIAEAARETGIRACAGAPIIVEGDVWGSMSVDSTDREPLPDDIEARLAEFTELVAAAISSAATREELARLAEEQAALRRVATLVATGAAPEEVFGAVVDEIAVVLPVEIVAMARYDADGAMTVVATSRAVGDRFPVGSRWPVGGENVSTIVAETGRPARIDRYADDSTQLTVAIRERGLHSSVGAPISVAGRVWGVMTASSGPEQPLPAGTETRLALFTELVATAISNTEARTETARLFAEQAALQRVATLVARGVAPAEVFTAVARELGGLLGVSSTHMGRYSADGAVTGVSSWSRDGAHVPADGRSPFDATSVTGLVFTTRRPARKDHYDDASDEIAAVADELGIRASVAAPIVVDGRLWGVMIASSDAPLAADTEARIAAFTELVATAISNTEAKAETARLTQEQAALRRVATLVAHSVPPGELFRAATAEAGALVGADLAVMARYEGDQTSISVATWAAAGEAPEVGMSYALEESDLTTRILSTGRPARMDGQDGASSRIAGTRNALGIESSVASPIIVEGRVWGGLVVHSTQAEPLPADTESRLMHFTELVAAAIASAQARSEVQRLADEQAALGRVATLVAHEPSPDEVFSAVAEELGGLLLVEGTRVIRYEDDGTATLLASWGEHDVPVGTRIAHPEDNIGALVRRTGRSARLDDYSRASGPLAAAVRELGFHSVIGSPILIEGRVWGATIALSRRPEPLPVGTEARIAKFTELIATALSNVKAQSDLAASRARIVAATDEERRRVVRDLHDGAQQRLVHTIVTLKLARRALQSYDGPGPKLVAEALDHAERTNVELRELAHGILPAVLTRGGLRAGVEALALRMPVPVEVAVSVDRLPTTVEATAYFVVAEALTNVAKYARARHAEVTARIHDGTLAVQVRDDGVGGAQPDGSGLVGLADRLAVLDGELRIESPADGGTLLTAAIPLPGE